MIKEWRRGGEGRENTPRCALTHTIPICRILRQSPRGFLQELLGVRKGGVLSVLSSLNLPFPPPPFHLLSHLPILFLFLFLNHPLISFSFPSFPSFSFPIPQSFFFIHYHPILLNCLFPIFLRPCPFSFAFPSSYLQFIRNTPPSQ